MKNKADIKGKGIEVQKGSDFTLKKLRDFLLTLSDEQLEQLPIVALEDCPTQELIGYELTEEDIFENKYDADDTGTLEEVKANYLSDIEFNINDYKIALPKGTVLFY